MLLSDIHTWHIYLDPQCEHTNPVKPKYVVVAAIEDEVIFGFLINSATRKLVLSTPAYAPCDVLLRREDYPFLRKQPVSHIDFTQLYKFQAKHFSEGYGRLLEDDLVAFVVAINECPRLSTSQKRSLLATTKRIMNKSDKK